VSEVHIALNDPSPEVNGKGLAKLEAAGISVYIGEEAEGASLLYEAYNKYVYTGLPFLTAKFACSLDGKIATSTGDSQWITCSEARLQVQQMRKATDAIMVGVNTVICDDPRLTVRNETGCPVSRQPLRVVLDSQGRTPPDARMFREPGKTLIATTVPGSKVDRPSVEAICLPCDGNGRVDISVLLEKLGDRGIVNLLVEGGSELFGALFDQQLIDKVVSYIAPIIIGGCKAPSPVGGVGVPTLNDSLQLENVTVEQIGSNFKIEGYPLRNP
jgi:diaminohydroxyphosphoribosylaminopyrimidine deaminase/5-amino-6-(5-phosphoribosylamino)uracil reductase